jgi:hypothetical protein
MSELKPRPQKRFSEANAESQWVQKFVEKGYGGADESWNGDGRAEFPRSLHCAPARDAGASVGMTSQEGANPRTQTRLSVSEQESGGGTSKERWRREAQPKRN